VWSWSVNYRSRDERPYRGFDMPSFGGDVRDEIRHQQRVFGLETLPELAPGSGPDARNGGTGG
jgi:hypothetical protein